MLVAKERAFVGSDVVDYDSILGALDYGEVALGSSR